MNFSDNLSYFIILLTLSACTHSPEIENNILRDRVKACSAGFSENTQADLHAVLNKAALDGELSGEIKEQTKSMIFESIPEKDREKAYRDYIRCIENNWNK